MNDREEIERDIYEALDRVASGQSTKDDAVLLAWATGYKWIPKQERMAA